jgi:HNH endonuclease
MGRLLRVDRRYRNPSRWTSYAYAVFWKWTLLIFMWIGVNILVTSVHLGWLALVTTGALITYAVHRLRVNRRRAAAPSARPAPCVRVTARPLRFNPPPGWPPVPAGWVPPPGWTPDPTWPDIPNGWQMWTSDQTSPPTGERNTRVIPQDVKIQVSVRDHGRCRQCGSTRDLHYDHVIPWSKGGANTVANIQLLCGLCNRAKGANEPAIR